MIRDGARNKPLISLKRVQGVCSVCFRVVCSVCFFVHTAVPAPFMRRSHDRRDRKRIFPKIAGFKALSGRKRSPRLDPQQMAATSASAEPRYKLPTRRAQERDAGLYLNPEFCTPDRRSISTS